MQQNNPIYQLGKFSEATPTSSQEPTLKADSSNDSSPRPAMLTVSHIVDLNPLYHKISRCYPYTLLHSWSKYFKFTS